MSANYPQDRSDLRERWPAIWLTLHEEQDRSTKYTGQLVCVEIAAALRSSTTNLRCSNE